MEFVHYLPCMTGGRSFSYVRGDGECSVVVSVVMMPGAVLLGRGGVN